MAMIERVIGSAIGVAIVGGVLYYSGLLTAAAGAVFFAIFFSLSNT